MPWGRQRAKRGLAISMRVLITNNTLAERAGSEMYVRDVALSLLRRGHQPVAYSTRLGAVAGELRAATVPVIDDLSQLGVVPDVIHGQHHMDAMTALLRFPGVPAVYFCHGWLPWEEMAPHFPSIRRYVAVDDLCQERLQCEHGIAPGRIRVIRNFVDVRRFCLRSELAPRPRRALAFSNYMAETGCFDILRRACSSRGIEFDAIGISAGSSEAQPESVLGKYDLVFAKGRCALEAIATGAAVIACDANGLGGMICPDNYEAMRRLNFGIRCLHQAIGMEAVAQEIDRYDVEKARQVSLRVRVEADMDKAIDQILEVYQEAIADDEDVAPSAEVLLQSASDYFRQIADFTKGRFLAERKRWIAEAESANQRRRAEEAENALQLAQAAVEEQARRAGQADAALSRLNEQSAAVERGLAQCETELAAIHGSRLWPVMNRLQRLRRLVWKRKAEV